MLAYILILGGIISLIFLIYSLTHLDQLNIHMTHPRLIVELVLFALFTVWGVLLLIQQSVG